VNDVYMNYKEIKDKTVNYLKETQGEAKKVVWPSRAYVVAATIIVFVIVFLLMFFVMFTDFCFAKIFQFLEVIKR